MSDIRAAIRAAADPVRAAGTARFFKTAPGQYGAGDDKERRHYKAME